MAQRMGWMCSCLLGLCWDHSVRKRLVSQGVATGTHQQMVRKLRRGHQSFDHRGPHSGHAPLFRSSQSPPCPAVALYQACASGADVAEFSATRAVVPRVHRMGWRAVRRAWGGRLIPIASSSRGTYLAAVKYPSGCDAIPITPAMARHGVGSTASRDWPCFGRYRECACRRHVLA